MLSSMLTGVLRLELVLRRQPLKNRRQTDMSSVPTTRLRITQIRSAIGSKPKQRGTLRALGLRGVGRANTLPDRPEIRGMIARVPHLVEVEEVA